MLCPLNNTSMGVATFISDIGQVCAAIFKLLPPWLDVNEIATVTSRGTELSSAQASVSFRNVAIHGGTNIGFFERLL